jgi:hypothetical protein
MVSRFLAPRSYQKQHDTRQGDGDEIENPHRLTLREPLPEQRVVNVAFVGLGEGSSAE